MCSLNCQTRVYYTSNFNKKLLHKTCITQLYSHLDISIIHGAQYHNAIISVLIYCSLKKFTVENFHAYHLHLYCIYTVLKIFHLFNFHANKEQMKNVPKLQYFHMNMHARSLVGPNTSFNVLITS